MNQTDLYCYIRLCCFSLFLACNNRFHTVFLRIRCLAGRKTQVYRKFLEGFFVEAVFVSSRSCVFVSPFTGQIGLSFEPGLGIFVLLVRLIRLERHSWVRIFVFRKLSLSTLRPYQLPPGTYFGFSLKLLH